VIHLLEPAFEQLPDRGLASDEQHGHLGSKGVGHSRDRVRYPRPRSDHRHSRNPGQPGPGVRRMSRRLLVSHVDDANVFIQAAVVDVHDMAAAEGKYGFDPFLLEGFRHQLSTGHVPHGCLLLNAA